MAYTPMVPCIPSPPPDPCWPAYFDRALTYHDQDLKPPFQHRGFLDLPFELRQIIYDYSTMNEPGFCSGVRTIPSIALALTCRQVHDEHISQAATAVRRFWSQRNLKPPTHLGLGGLEITFDDDCKSERILSHIDNYYPLTSLDYILFTVRDYNVRRYYRRFIWRPSLHVDGRADEEVTADLAWQSWNAETPVMSIT